MRFRVWKHRLDFGADGVGPNAHGFVADPEFIEADRQRKDRILSRREARIHESELTYLRQIGAEDVARRSRMESEWRERERAR